MYWSFNFMIDNFIPLWIIDNKLPYVSSLTDQIKDYCLNQLLQRSLMGAHNYDDKHAMFCIWDNKFQNCNDNHDLLCIWK